MRYKATRAPPVSLLFSVIYLVAHNGFLYRSEILKGGEEDVTPLRPSDVLNEVAELLAQGNKHFVLILDRFYRVSGLSSWAQSASDRVEKEQEQRRH